MQDQVTDVVLIGGGIMSATLGAFLKELEPNWSISLFERLDDVAQESSDPWNNAGTGHSALCELNYTPQNSDGSVDITKALSINEQFQTSRQFWSYVVEHGFVANPKDFINPVAHMSFVRGDENCEFLQKRFDALRQSFLFDGMEYSEDRAKLNDWIPLMMEGRSENERVAATRTNIGTDVNFGALTHLLFSHLQKHGAELFLKHEVVNLKKQTNGTWKVSVKDLRSGETKTIFSRFVFIGAGGGSLPLLQKSGIPEGKHIGGFPVSGLFLRCTKPEIVATHNAKVYGKASVGAPPMSVPHLDTRVVDGKSSILFGPFAGFSPKFLKSGSLTDLLTSITFDNIGPMISAGLDNMPLTSYLIKQVLLSKDERIEALREFVPNADGDDWELIVAGQRVQVIKQMEQKRGVLQFGTELVSAADGSIAALLGASPGASTTVTIMLKLLQRCFAGSMDRWEAKLTEMIPSYGKSLAKDKELCDAVHARTSKILQING